MQEPGDRATIEHDHDHGDHGVMATITAREGTVMTMGQEATVTITSTGPAFLAGSSTPRPFARRPREGGRRHGDA